MKVSMMRFTEINPKPLIFRYLAKPCAMVDMMPDSRSRSTENTYLFVGLNYALGHFFSLHKVFNRHLPILFKPVIKPSVLVIDRFPYNLALLSFFWEEFLQGIKFLLEIDSKRTTLTSCSQKVVWWLINVAYINLP